MNIIDNALDQESFLKIKQFMFNECDWYWNDDIVDGEDKIFPYTCLFTHNFFEVKKDHQLYWSQSYSLLLPILQILQPTTLGRIKGNMYVNQNKFVEHEMHTDTDKGINAAIYYVNSNNGKTIFLDGSEVESIENRLVIFKANQPHKSTNCTDQWRTININFNYF